MQIGSSVLTEDIVVGPSGGVGGEGSKVVGQAVFAGAGVRKLRTQLATDRNHTILQYAGDAKEFRWLYQVNRVTGLQ